MQTDFQQHGPLLLSLARRSLAATLSGVEFQLDPKELPAALLEWHGCFVTLTQAGQLRGCVGQVFPQSALYQALQDSAAGAALRDPRFSPVLAEELSGLRIEISVLGEVEALEYGAPEELLDKIRPHGVVMRLGDRTATFLPQVWEHFPDPEVFLDRLSEKAGYPRGAWRKEEMTIWLYSVQKFVEPEQE